MENGRSVSINTCVVYIASANISLFCYIIDFSPSNPHESGLSGFINKLSTFRPQLIHMPSDAVLLTLHNSGP